MEENKTTTEKSIDPRKITEFDEAFALAENIVTKNYLSGLENLEIVSDKQYLKTAELKNYASLFQLKKIVYNKDESNLQKLVNTYASAAGFKSDVIMIIYSNGKELQLYLGTSGAKEVTSARSSATTLSNNFAGNFSGSETKLLDNNELNVLINRCTDFNFSSIASVSGVASPRDKDMSNLTNTRFIQGIEKMIDAMSGIPFSAIFIANYIDSEQLEDIKAEYEVLYSKLMPFYQSTLTYNESSSEGVTKTISNSFSKTLTESRSTALSVGSSESKTHTEGNFSSHANTGGINAGITIPIGKSHKKGGIPFGVSFSHTYAKGKSSSDALTFGTSKNETEAKGKSTSEGETNTESEAGSHTETVGRTLQITYQNKTVKQLLDTLDEQLNRLRENGNYGSFATAGYFMAPDSMAANIAASAYKGLVNGNSTHVETSQINLWHEESKVRLIKQYLRKLQHPMFRFEKSNVVTPATIVSASELAIQMGMPMKSLPGIPVIETAAFGLNPGNERKQKHRDIKLGNLYHMGKDESVPVNLDLESLTMHTFITGSTGAGKSNAIYRLLEEVIKNGKTTFMVIEPAKGEYKNKFGSYKGVKVYGTNYKKNELLTINPFSFPEDMHILEHIDRLVEIFNVCWPMYAAMPAVLKDAIERAYENAGWDLELSECSNTDYNGNCLYPNFIDVLSQIKLVMDESDYSSDSKGDYSGALCTRVKSLTNGIYGQIFSGKEIPDSELFDSNVIVDLSRVGSVETKSLIMGLLIMKMQEYRMSRHSGSNSLLKHLTVLEEAHNLLKRTSTEQSADSSNLLGKSVEMLANSIAEMRTYGEGFIIADQSPGLLDMSVIRNTNTKIILRLPDISDRELVGKAAGLTDVQITELSKLKTGIAAVYQNDWIEPVLCHIERCRDDETEFIYDEAASKAVNQDDKLKIIDYLLLPAPHKLELNSDEIAALEKTVFGLRISTETKLSLLKYIKEKNPENIQSYRQKIIYELFNSKAAFAMSARDRHDIERWKEAMTEKLSPDISALEETERNKILAIIAYEHAEHTGNSESVELFNKLISTIS